MAAVRLLLEKLFLGAEPVLFVLAGFAATTFIEFVGPFPNLVLGRSIVWHQSRYAAVRGSGHG
jgi:hypothetical protein